MALPKAKKKSYANITPSADESTGIILFYTILEFSFLSVMVLSDHFVNYTIAVTVKPEKKAFKVPENSKR